MREFTFPLLFVVGAVLGAAVNGFVDRFCWTPRFRSPWNVLPREFLERLNSVTETSKKRKTTTPLKPFQKGWFDFIPILGWISLSRMGRRLELLPEEDRLPGLETASFWIRPFFTELFAALGVCWLCFWEVDQQGLLPLGLLPEPSSTLWLRFGVHVVFFGLLLAASLIDFDDMIIPDAVTAYGTVLGLIFAASLPQTLLPVTEWSVGTIGGFTTYPTIDSQAVPLQYYSPRAPELAPWFVSTISGKAILIFGLWWFWCFAMLERVWYTQLPFRKAAAIFCRRLKRSSTTRTWFGAAFILPLPFVFNWALGLFPAEWLFSDGLLTALIGMATGMGMIWGGRLVAGFVLDREAMGFGDVTLMGMIGAFVGWQTTILIFFLAPCIGLGFAVAQYLMGRGKELPYGPYLCLATLFLVVGWRNTWEFAAPIFDFGPVVLAAAMFVCLFLLGTMLAIWLRIKQVLFRD